MHFFSRYTYCNLVSRQLNETLGASFFADRRSGSSPLRLYPVSWLYNCGPTFSTISLARRGRVLHSNQFQLDGFCIAVLHVYRDTLESRDRGKSLPDLDRIGASVEG